MLDKENINRIQAIAGHQPGTLLHVTIAAQSLAVIENNRPLVTYPVSTSRFGIGNREGSNMTPEGVHCIADKIGASAPIGRIFESRRDTGRDWTPGMTEENLILTRILRLRGLEPGINSGAGIDSYDRYIYIHGTNKENLIGTPISHGCVCMRNADIVALFDMVGEGTIVFIDKG